MDREIKHRHRTPSPKQIKALQLISQGYSKRRAMMESGYSTNYSNTGSVTKSRAAVQILDSMKTALYKNPKLAGDYLAGKFEKWLEAQKGDKDDYKTQIEAMKLYKDIMQPQKEDQGVKRRVTFEEFVGEPNETNKIN